MKKNMIYLAAPLWFILCLTGCTAVGQKTTSMSVIYAVMALLSLILLVSYCYLIKKKDIWFILLFGLVSIVNVGYFSLSIATALEEALLANRIAYLGSVFLPMTMLMIILNVTRMRVSKIVPGVLFILGLAVFFVAASPGFLNIYYKEVSLIWVNGVAVLSKVYGPWHGLYSIYLLLYFAAIIIAVIQAAQKKMLVPRSQTVILAVAVFVNMGVWLIEQLVKIDFEFLSVSYVISELFLLCMYLMLQEGEKNAQKPCSPEVSPSPELCQGTEEDDLPKEFPRCPFPQPSADALALFRSGLDELTYTERLIYQLYLEKKSTKEILTTLNIKENTLKYHNKNLYSKLGISSRKELIFLAGIINTPPIVKPQKFSSFVIFTDFRFYPVHLRKYLVY